MHHFFVAIGTRLRGSVRRARARIPLNVVCAVLAGTMLMVASPSLYAATTGPQRHIYTGRLLDNNGNAITTAHNIRFSYWKSIDYTSADTTGTGAINTGSANYANWQEVHTITPDSSGHFSVQLGSITALPSLSTYTAAQLQSLFLQIEVKASANPDTSYELLDSDAADSAVDRSPILSVPFALNADLLDQHDVGTGSGSIPLLGSGGRLPISTVPGGTNTSLFILDNDNSESATIGLQFGATLAKTLTYDISANKFIFNAPVEIQGNLTVTGFVNGVDVTQLQSSTGALKAFAGAGLTLRVSGGSYRLRGTQTNYAGGSINLAAASTSYVYFGSGGLTASVIGFPTDESFIPLAQAVTSGVAITSVADRRAMESDDREHVAEMTFNPLFEKAAYQGDGTDNVGQLLTTVDNITLKTFYAWTSTRGSLQDYDVVLHVTLPPTFVRWQDTSDSNPLSLGYRSTSASATNNKLDIQVYDTNGAPVTLSGSSTGLASLSWTTTSLEFGNGATWTAGQNFLIRIKVYAKDAFQMQIGNLKLQYVELAR